MPRVVRLRWRALAAALVVSCVDGARSRPPTQPSARFDAGVTTLASQSPTSPCTDRDGDTFGSGCAAGPDCDDGDPARTDECYACLRPSEGCACAGSEAPVPCNRATGASATIGIQRGDGALYDAVSYNEPGIARPANAMRWSPTAAGVCDGEGACVRCDARERCDGRDNTCDGRVDEGFDAVSCGVGACRRVVPGCDHGATGACTPGEPAPEACNGVDDDCNGLVDDDCHG